MKGFDNGTLTRIDRTMCIVAREALFIMQKKFTWGWLDEQPLTRCATPFLCETGWEIIWVRVHAMIISNEWKPSQVGNHFGTSFYVLNVGYGVMLCIKSDDSTFGTCCWTSLISQIGVFYGKYISYWLIYEWCYFYSETSSGLCSLRAPFKNYE